MNNNLKPTEQHVRYHQQSSEGTTSSVEQGFRPFNLDVKSLAPEILSLGLWLVNPPCAIGEQVSQTHNINGQHKYLRERTTSNRKRAKVIAARIYTTALNMLLHSEERGMHGQRWYIGASYLVTNLERVGTRSTLNFELRPNHNLKWTELHPT